MVELMSPDELRELKRLTEKLKGQKKQLAGAKEELARQIYTTFGAQIRACKKDVVSITTGKEAYSDGQIWAVSVGTETKDDESNASELAVNIMDNHLSDIEGSMGMGNSLRITFKEDSNDKDTPTRFVMFRKREAEVTESTDTETD